ncbi:serine/threonine protein phosphatase 2A 57 kDa regulatory subunit B' kappa isoform-like [Punica granatum]|uniref:Serine/threonine protein phosphatase 2A regulatory subunit n=2 Tax=Punica granatum TaxID=22663 RepID=A0A218W115_PUNGR|nr:serine/threonine protein phosphatase 2A 57 kDa regulatory subunit B' kappa isoform-like [Punica granatum]OWM66000.1 hypothetical protein CDL15_Pgr015426 [Punica granatum]PKI66694.1 hypothetical protein CRG98_012889 [Punica granatum]
MLKQFLNKIPRKSPKPDSLDAEGIEPGDNSNGFQCTLGGTTFSSRFNVVKRVSSAVFPTGGAEAVDPHMSFKDVSNSQKHGLFLSKLNLCCEVYDFNDHDKNYSKINLKHETLIELVDFVSSGSAKFNEATIAATCKMCAVNLFRVFPPKDRSNSIGGEADDIEEPMFDPAWSHLQLVYDLLLRFVSYNSLDPKVAKKYVDHSFVLRLLDLFDSEDPRERDSVKTIMHRVYGKFMVHRPFIRKAVSNVIYRFVFETERHNGMAEILEIFGSVITGFALPLKEEHKMFLLRALLPLHKPKPLGVYHQQLTYCVVQFINKDPKLASVVIKGLLKYWPITNSQKELMFLSELEEVLEMTSLVEFQKVVGPLFRKIASCLNSSHYQVAERAHLLWNNEHVLSLVSQNRQAIVPLVVSALERNTQNHWNQAVLNLTRNLKKILSEMDEELVTACQRAAEEESSTLSSSLEKRRAAWEHLEIAAGNSLISTDNAACSVAC